MPYEERITYSKSTAEDVDNLILSYNRVQAKDKGEVEKQIKLGYSKEHAEKLLKTEQEKVIAAYSKEATELKEKMLKYIKEYTEDIHKSKYPGGNFPEDTQNALLFLGVNKNNAAIINAITQAIQNGLPGYASALTDNVLIEFADISPENSEAAARWAALSKEKRDLYDKVAKIRDEFYNTTGINNILTAIKNYSSLGDELEGFIDALNNKQLAHIPEIVTKNMDEKTGRKLIDFIMASIPYYKNSNRFAGYKIGSDESQKVMAAFHLAALT